MTESQKDDIVTAAKDAMRNDYDDEQLLALTRALEGVGVGPITPVSLVITFELEAEHGIACEHVVEAAMPDIRRALINRFRDAGGTVSSVNHELT